MNVLKYKILRQAILSDRLNRDPRSGFTLIELLVVIIIVGVLATIIGPGWLSFLNQRRVNAVHDAVSLGIQEAQNKAQSEKIDYSVSFRNNNGVPQIAIHPASVDPNDPANRTTMDNYWRAGELDLGLQPGQVILQTNLTGQNSIPISPTTQSPVTTVATTPTGITNKRISFDYTGALKEVVDSENIGEQNAIAIVVAAPRGNSSTDPIFASKRCVMVRTLLGGLTTGQGQYNATSNPQGCP